LSSFNLIVVTNKQVNADNIQLGGGNNESRVHLLIYNVYWFSSLTLLVDWHEGMKNWCWCWCSESVWICLSYFTHSERNCGLISKCI